MTAQPIEVPLDLNGNYVDQVNAASQATQGLASSVDALQTRTSGVQRALDRVTPTKAHIAAWAGFTTAAAYFQAEVNPIKTTAVAAGRSLNGLESDVRSLARSMPVGTGGAVQLVQTVQALGVGAGSTRGQVRALATDLGRLEAANNAMGTGLGLSFGQLNRQMASLDPARLSKFGDVLTRVSAQSGASATGIVDFARNIAPMAQQAGIGETAVLGISSAFVKLGDDGYSAATAVNKILGDLNRSVREGSNDMAAYAQIVGMTTGQFSKLYRANPTQALTQVVGAIGRAGPQGQMQLESIGLEGVRTQRALLQLSQSGGLGAAISSAQRAYGSGATDAAAKQAFSGLNNELTMFRTTVGQVADSLGGPFLNAVTQVVHLASMVLRPVNAVLGSGVGQHAVGAVGGVALAGLALRRVFSPLSTASLAYQAGTSGPMRSLAGGFAFNRAGGDLEAATATRLGRFGQDPMMYGAMGAPYGRGAFMQGLNRRFGAIGAGFGQAANIFSEGAGPSTGGGFSLLRGARAGVTASTMAAEAYINSLRDPMHQSTLAASERQSLLVPREGGLLSRAGMARRDAIASAEGGMLNKQLQGLRVSLGMVEKEGGTSAAALSRLASATGGAAASMGRFIEAGTMASASAGKSALTGLWNTAGGAAGVGMLAGFGAYSYLQRGVKEDQQYASTMRNTDIYGVANSWKDAVGAASNSAMTMAEAMRSATDTINAGVKNFPSARVVSAADITAAGKFNPADVRKNAALSYLGSDATITSEIQAGSLTGMTPQDMQGVKMQLIRQGLPPERINRILAGVRTGGTAGAITPGVRAGLSAGFHSAYGSYARHGGGFGDAAVEPGRDASKVAQEMAGSLGQQQQILGERFGQRYATQQTARSLRDLINATPQGSPERGALTHALSRAMGYTGKSEPVQGWQSVDQVLGLKGVSIGGMHGQSLIDLMNGGNIARHLQPSIMEAPLRGAGATALLPFFTAARAPQQFRAGQRAAEYVASGHEADIGAMTKATNAMVEAATKSGTSLTDLAVQAGKASSATAGWQQQLMAMVLAQAQFRQQVSLQGATRETTWRTMMGADIQTMQAGAGKDPNGAQAQAYNAAKEDLAQRRADVISYYQQRLMAQFQFQIQSQRSAEDYNKQVFRAEQGYNRQRMRSIRDFNIQRQREIQDAAVQDYSVYTRIQTQPTWDAVNLLGNAREQLQAMRQQVTNIRTLKGLGMTEAALRMVDAYNPQNAQQIQQLVYDLQGNTGLVAQYDRTASARERAAGNLLGMSTQFQHQKADFQRGLRDTRSDFNLAMRQQRTDYLTAMSRAAQDLHNSDMEITNDLEKLQRNMQRVVNGQTVDFKDLIANNMQDALDIVRHKMGQINNTLNNGPASPHVGGGTGGVSLQGGRSGGGYGGSPVAGSGYTTLPSGKRIPNPGGDTGFAYVKPGTGTVYHGPTDDRERPSSSFRQNHPAHPSYNMQIAKSMKPAWAHGDQWKAWHDLWETESGWSQYAYNGTDPMGYGQTAYGIPQSYPGSKMGQYGRDWQTNPATQIAWGIHYIAGKYGSPLNVARRMGLWSGHYQGYDEGGIATKPHLGMVAESGSAEMMIPLNQRGAHFLVDAMKQYVSSSDAAKIATGGMGSATYVTDNSKHYYDHRNDFSGADITVKATNPRELAQALEAKARADGLTATRGVQSGG